MFLEGTELVFYDNKFQHASEVGTLAYTGYAVKLYINDFINIVTEMSSLVEKKEYSLSSSVEDISEGSKLKLNVLNESDFINSYFSFEEGVMIGLLYSGAGEFTNERIEFIRFSSFFNNSKVLQSLVRNCLTDYAGRRIFSTEIALVDKESVEAFVIKYGISALSLLPKSIYMAGSDFLVGFLTGFLSNGYVGEGKIVFNSKNSSLFIELSKLLLFYGIKSNIYKINYAEDYWLYRITFSWYQLKKLCYLGNCGERAFELLSICIPEIKSSKNGGWIKINKMVVEAMNIYDMYILSKEVKHFLLKTI